MSNDPKKQNPEIEPTPITPAIPEKTPEVIPEPDKTEPEPLTPETEPGTFPETQPWKE